MLDFPAAASMRRHDVLRRIEMTPRERVMSAFAHEEPDRVPCWCGASPGFLEKATRSLGMDEEGFRRRIGDDFRRVAAPWVDPDPLLSAGATWRSPFGVERSGIGYGQPLSHPLASSLSMRGVLEYPWPDAAMVDVSGLRAQAAAWGGEFAVLGGDWSPFWHDAIDLVGMEGLCYLMYDEPELASLLFERVGDFYFEASKRVFEEAGGLIDVFFIGNDFGSTTGPLLGPGLFARFISPTLRRLSALGHRHGLKVMLHCCGGFRPLIPLMIADGVDGLHALQPRCAGMEPEALKRDFGGALLLNGAIDTQVALLEGSPRIAREETFHTLDVMARGGGYVAGPSHDWLLEETPLENVLALYGAVSEWNDTRR
jgi:uroporphyrinogen decarboxylase